MRSIRWTVVAVVLLAGTALAQSGPRPWASKVPPELVRKANPLPPSPAVIAAGKEVYANTCLPCHGEGAQGDGPAAQFIQPPPKPLISGGKITVPEGVAFWVITNGIDGTGMASLSDTLSENERWQVIRYLQAMARPAAAQPAPGAAATPAPAPDAGGASAPAPNGTPAPPSPANKRG